MNRLTASDGKNAALAGLFGAGVLTVVHESLKHVVPHAPRTDVLGSRAIVATFRRLGLPRPRPWPLYAMAIGADLSSNAAVYAAVAVGGDRSVYRRGGLIGAATGLTAWLLPPAIGLGRMPGRRTPYTQAMTLAWYTAGGLAAAWAWQRLRRR